MKSKFSVTIVLFISLVLLFAIAADYTKRYNKAAGVYSSVIKEGEKTITIDDFPFLTKDNVHLRFTKVEVTINGELKGEYAEDRLRIEIMNTIRATAQDFLLEEIACDQCVTFCSKLNEAINEITKKNNVSTFFIGYTLNKDFNKKIGCTNESNY